MKFFFALAVLLTFSHSEAKPVTGFVSCTFSYRFVKDGSVGYRLTGRPSTGNPQILVETEADSHHSEEAYEDGTANLCALKKMKVCGKIFASEDGQLKPIPTTQCHN